MPLAPETSKAKSQAQEVLFSAIAEAVAELKDTATPTAQAEALRNLAEAYAWLANPSQPH